ncbi:HAD family hydrolase [Bailinhaonella thermotolerans]|uniref:HAD-IIB family hydrolase n=1 Tax=Bailinhaonella thermotolerans TaxID=1070861 RepID=A0A3A4AT10_9ACTN|nr:HAD family hydrolase [Bailinhaonella thermotolerans]RJL31719.1 HAD-IIB family hydrolase [Bailinhaonella thermotolerans]
MRYHALACDYDGTIAHGGTVGEETIGALERVSRSRRKLILVTGRELDDLFRVFPHCDLFDLIVAENGGVLYEPAHRTVQPLAAPPPPAFVERLRAECASPLGVGHVIVATREPYDKAVLEAIRDMGLELHVIYNKGAVMVLPPGVNKASGLAAALERLNMSPHNVVGVGDAENDHAFLSAAECGVAVADALPSLKDACDLVLARPDGQGVTELAERLLDDDLADVDVSRWDVVLGHTRDESEVRLAPYGSGVVVAGPSGSGKSTAATALLERLTSRGYQCCIIDPEGDYAEYPDANVLGDPERVPTVEEALRLLEPPRQSLVVNLLGMPLRDRPAFCAELLPRLAGLRARLGHPHWVILDEAHHLLPAELGEIPLRSPEDVGALLMITVHPESISPAALTQVDTVVAVGDDPERTLSAFAGALDRPAPEPAPGWDDADLVLWRTAEGAAQAVRLLPARVQRTRHRRKYAAGTMSRDKSFYFTGPDDRLKLRARNLDMFLELAEGVDDETWLHHLERGDYSSWIRDKVGDDELAGHVAEVERAGGDPRETRERVADLVNRRYTLPAEPTDYDPDHDDDTR